MTEDEAPANRQSHKPRPRVYAGKPFAHFQWNYGWGVWEQVTDNAAGKRGVVTAYAPPAESNASVLKPQASECTLATDENSIPPPKDRKMKTSSCAARLGPQEANATPSHLERREP